MKVVRIHRTGDPDVLTVEDAEAGAPGPGEVRVRHAAIGLNFIDINYRIGKYPISDFPAVLGTEGAGVVEAVGGGVDEFEAGDRVAYGGGANGAYAEVRVMPVDRLVRLPDDIDEKSAAAMMLKGVTAQYLLRGAYRVEPGETILVHAAAGGVGTILCQWAKHLGATVIGSVGSEQKAEVALAHGCDHAIVHSREDVVARVRDITDGSGVSAVYDSVGKDTFEASLDCLRRRGTLVSYGTASGMVPPFDIFQLNLKGSLYLTSAGLFDYTFERAELLERTEELFAVVRSGAVRIEVNQTYPLAEAARAHADLEGRRNTGSSILLP